jgi:hypothetical protein
VHQSLRSIARILGESFGREVPLFHNYPVTFPMTPLDTPGAESYLDWQGVDAYPTREMYQTIRRGMKYTSTVSRLPHLAEFSSGSVYYGLPLGLADQKFTTWATVMHGIKGINFYMIVERERWYGSPVTRDGKLRDDRYDFYTKFLNEVKLLGLEDMKPKRQVMLLSVRDYERMLAGSIVPVGNSTIIGEFGGWASPDLWASRETHGLSEPVGARYTALFSFWYRVLSSVGAHFGIGDSECGPDMFDGYKLVIAPSFEFMDSSVQEKLLAFADRGGTVIVGPRAPKLDSSMKPCAMLAERMREPSSSTTEGATVFGVEVEEVLAFDDGEAGNESVSLMYSVPVGKGKLVHLGLVPGRVVSPADAAPFVPLVDTLVRSAGIEPCYIPADPRVDVSVLEGGGGAAVFVANPTDETLDTTIELCPPGGLRGPGGGSLQLTGTSVRISLEPWSITVLEPGGPDAGA